jgi:hypothetical protein
MNRQIRTWQTMQTMAGGAVLLCGIALCTWMGGVTGAADKDRTAVRTASGLINPDARYRTENSVRAFFHTGEGSAGPVAQGDQSPETEPVVLRDAIYSIPVPRSGARLAGQLIV